MKVIQHLSLSSFLVLLICLSSHSSAAQNKQYNELIVNPERCVALRQGQTCYQEVTFAWQQPKPGNFCIVELATQEVLKCWQHVRTGKFNFDFQSNQSKHFALREKGNNQNLSEASITVSWVFKSSKRSKSSWRLF